MSALSLAGPVVGVAIAGVLIVGALIFAPSPEEKPTGMLAVAPGADREIIQETDTDGDGVPDWKEILWGSDPYRIDTDGDGIPDSEEIGRGDDPTVVGPGNKETGYVAPRALSPTEALAREFFASYAAVRQDGVINEAETEAALTEVLERRAAEPINVPVVTFADLVVEPDVSPKAYQGALANILEKAHSVREYELNVFARAFRTQSPSELAKITRAGAVYRGIVNDLKKMQVPSAVAHEHLATVQNILILGAAAEALGTWTGDPLDALALINQFTKAEEGVDRSLNDLYRALSIMS